MTALKKVMTSSGNSQHVNLHKEPFWTHSVFLWDGALGHLWSCWGRHQLFQDFGVKLASAPWLSGTGVHGLWQEGAQWHLHFLHFCGSEGSWVPCPTPSIPWDSDSRLCSDSPLHCCRGELGPAGAGTPSLPPAVPVYCWRQGSYLFTALDKEVLWWLSLMQVVKVLEMVRKSYCLCSLRNI